MLPYISKKTVGGGPHIFKESTEFSLHDAALRAELVKACPLLEVRWQRHNLKTPNSTMYYRTDGSESF